MVSRLLLAMLLVALFQSPLLAQKLPNKQEVSVALPANLKINGKADEWNNQYQAYNSATQLKYTIANNDKDLYIVVNADDRTIVQKIGLFGITLTISPVVPNDKKVSITYPQKKINNILPLPNVDITEAVLRDANAKLSADAKTMKITGVKDITEEETSIYNSFDIRAAAAIDAQRSYTTEFAIPLKYLSLDGKTGQTVKFDIQINGPAKNPWPTQTITQSADGKYTAITAPVDGSGRTMTLEIRTTEYISLTVPFNFSGEYKLK